MLIFRSYKNAFSNLHSKVWILAITMLINRSGSMVLLFTSLYLTKELHFSIATAGLVMGSYGVGGILGSFTGGWLTDRGNAFKIMFWALIGSGAVLFLLPLLQNPILIGATIFTHAFFADLFRPANSKSIVFFSTVENRTRSLSLVRLAVNLGFSIGPAAGGLIAIYLGYHWLFVLDGCTSILAAGMLWLYFPRTIELQKSTTEEPIQKKGISAYKDSYYLVFIGLTAIYGTCFFQIFASVPQFYNQISGYPESWIGGLMALNGFVVVVFEMPLVAWLENLKKPFAAIVAGVFCIPVSFGILFFSQPLLAGALLYTVIITLSEILAMPFMMNLALSRAGNGRQGQYAALYAIAFGIATLLAPSVGLGIADWLSFGWMFGFFSIVSLLVAVGFMILSNKTSIKSNE